MTKAKVPSNLIFFSMLTFIAIAKIHFANTGFVNFEGLFVELAKFLADSTANLKDTMYFEWQANPIGTSFIQGLFYNIFPETFLAYPGIMSRLPAILLLLPTAYALRNFFIRFFPSLDFMKASLLALLLLLHPFIWNFTGRSTSDSIYIPLMLLVFAYYLDFIKDRSTKNLLIVTFLLTFSVVIKINTLAILGVLGLHTFFENIKFAARQKNILKAILTDHRLVIAVATLLTFISYYFLTKLLNLPLVQNDEALHQFGASYLVRNFFFYNEHFFIASIPCSLVSLYFLIKNQTRKQLIILAIISAIICVGLYKLFPIHHMLNIGELGFGAMVDNILLRFMPFWHFPFLFISALFFLLIIQRAISTDVSKIEFAVITLLISSILLHSMLKPVQRYLVFCILLHLSLSLIYLQTSQTAIKSRFLAFFAVAFIGFSFILSINNKFKTDAYKDFGDQIIHKYKNDKNFWLHAINDPLQYNFYGNIPEEMLSRDKRRNYCIYENEPGEALITSSTYNWLSKSTLTLSLRTCEDAQLIRKTEF